MSRFRDRHRVPNWGGVVASLLVYLELSYSLLPPRESCPVLGACQLHIGGILNEVALCANDMEPCDDCFKLEE